MKNIILLFITSGFFFLLSCCPCPTDWSDCVKACDAEAEMILKNYEDCQDQVEENLVIAIQSCIELFPPGEGRVRCITDARQRAREAKQACERTYKAALAENRRCWIKCHQTSIKDNSPETSN